LTILPFQIDTVVYNHRKDLAIGSCLELSINSSASSISTKCPIDHKDTPVFIESPLKKQALAAHHDDSLLLEIHSAKVSAISIEDDVQDFWENDFFCDWESSVENENDIQNVNAIPLDFEFNDSTSFQDLASSPSHSSSSASTSTASDTNKHPKIIGFFRKATAEEKEEQNHHTFEELKDTFERREAKSARHAQQQKARLQDINRVHLCLLTSCMRPCESTNMSHASGLLTQHAQPPLQTDFEYCPDQSASLSLAQYHASSAQHCLDTMHNLLVAVVRVVQKRKVFKQRNFSSLPLIVLFRVIY
jgi:hypothetical protein